MITPAQPISAISAKAAGSYPSGAPESRILRNAPTADLSCVQVRAASRSMLCSSVRTAMVDFFLFSLCGYGAQAVDLEFTQRLFWVRQVKHPLGDDVVLDLVGTPVDRRRLAAQPAADG